MASITTRRLFLSMGLTTALLTSALTATEPEKPATPAVPKDYGRGFAKFYALGLPDAKGAQYVKFTFYSGHPDYSGMYDYSMRQANLTGTGWIIESKSTNTPSRYITGVHQFEVYDRKMVESERRARQKAAREKAKEGDTGVIISDNDDDKTSGSWRETDPAADSRKLIAFLEKQSAERHFMYQLREMSGPIFLEAAHLHRNGYTNEANQLVEQLFSISDDRQQVILGALNTLADAQFEQTTEAFFAELDWSVYGAELLKLLKRFRSGWQKAPAVKRLYTAVQTRIQDLAPAEIQGEGVTEEDRALARALCSMTPKDVKSQHYYLDSSAWSDRTLWILAPPATNATETAEPAPTQPVSSNIIERIRMRGVASVPLLLAMLDDNFLLTVDKQEAVSGGRTYYYSSSREMTEERITQLYNQLNRPATRGEIARAMLQQILPVDDQESRQTETMDGDEFKQAFTAWYSANRDKTPLVMARGYLAEGSREQKRSALQFLSRFGSDDDLAIVEKTFLEGEHHEYSHLIAQYVQQRGEKATAFVAQYTNQLMATIGEDEGNAAWIGQTVKQLERIVSAGSLNDVLAEIVSGQKTFADMQEILQSRLWQADEPEKALHAVLDAATRVANAQDAANLLGLVMNIGHTSRMRRGAQAEAPPDLGPHTDLWKKLVADKRTIAGRWSRGRETTLGDQAAWTLEYIYAGDMSTSLHQAATLGDRVLPLIRKRATARLEGTEPAQLPALPSGDNVSAEELDALVTRLKGSDAMAETLEGLSMDALLALREPFTEQSNLWAMTANVAHRIREVQIDEPLQDQLQYLATLQGKLLQPAMLDRLISDGLAVAASNMVANVMFYRESALAGITITATCIDSNHTQYADWSYYLRHKDPKGRARVHIALSFPDLHKSAQWYSEAPTQAADTAKSNSDGNGDMLDEFEDELEDDTNRSAVDAQEALRKALVDCCAARCNVYPAAKLQIVAVPANPPGVDSDSTDPF